MPPGAGARAWPAAALALAALLAGAGAAAAQTMDDAVYTYVALDELEVAPAADPGRAAYSGQAWVGGDVDRLWVRLEGEHATAGGAGEVGGEVLWSRMVHPFWDVQGGVRVDGVYGRDDRARGRLALGVAGLAPYWFEVEAFAFLSPSGGVSARASARYEVLFTQRLILEPEAEVRASSEAVPAYGVGAGLGDVELGARLRFEVVREVAPYVGWAWTRRFGDTARLAEARSEGALVAGVRLWY